MVSTQSGHLRRVCDDQHLNALSEPGQSFTDRGGNRAADTGDTIAQFRGRTRTTGKRS